MAIETILLILLLLAGFYMAWNIGANDVANAMGTSVGSGALTLRQAIFVAAILEFAGAYFFGSYVSETLQNGIVNPDLFAGDPLILVYGMLASLLAAGVWLQIASYFGWPVSTTHSIVGAVIGFGIIAGGVEGIYWGNVTYIVTSWVISPLCGAILSYFIFTLLRKKIFYSANPTESAKKMTPYLVFIVLFVLTLILLFNGLKNLHLDLSFIQAFSLSVGISALGSVISYFLVQRVESPSAPQKEEPVHDPEISIALEKARKHLLRAQLASSGELQYQVGSLLEEVDGISSSLKPHPEYDVSSSEYSSVEKIFGYLQIMSACMMAFAHGANDVANAIGPLSAGIGAITTGVIAVKSEVPTWALALGGFGIIIGLATWGWRVIYTIGKKITELTPTRGFAAEFGAAATVVIASRLGLPISTTHTLVGSVLGVGFARGIGALNLTTTRDIVISWLVTVPAGALLAMGFFYIFRAIFE